MKKQIDTLTETLDNILNDYNHLVYDYEISDLDETIHFEVEVFDSDRGKDNGVVYMRIKVNKECKVEIEIGEDCWEPLDYCTRDEMNFWKAFLDWPF